MVQQYKPTLRRPDMAGVLEAIADEKIGPGERKTEFENVLSSLLGYKKAFALRSISVAIRFAFKSLFLKPGSTILLSPLSPVVYKRVAEEFGFKIIYSDTDLDSGAIIYTEEAENVDAIVQYLPGSLLPQEDFKKFKDKTIVDASALVGRKGISDYGFSAIVSTEDDDLISTAGGAVLFFDENPDIDIYKEDEMCDLNAALGLIQCKYFDKYNIKRREIIERFYNAYLRTDGKNRLFCFPLPEAMGEDYNAFHFDITVNMKEEEIKKFAKKSDIEVKRRFENSICSLLSPKEHTNISNSFFTFLRCISFPHYYFLKQSEIDTVAKGIAHLI